MIMISHQIMVLVEYTVLFFAFHKVKQNASCILLNFSYKYLLQWIIVCSYTPCMYCKYGVKLHCRSMCLASSVQDLDSASNAITQNQRTVDIRMSYMFCNTQLYIVFIHRLQSIYHQFLSDPLVLIYHLVKHQIPKQCLLINYIMCCVVYYCAYVGKCS